ncbi:MAG: hypothetical protein R8J94_04450 [Acidimicrobiia bacterium]|nr:hypothetical protein [Acidimicrobiia bacterium]
MKRAAILIMAVVVLAAIGLDSPSDAQAPTAFETSWCASPVVVPIAMADATSTRTAANVATARGAEASLSSLGPVVRMEEFGSRVQVTLGETLFHTQFLFAGVGPEDSVRVDARLGRAEQPIEASAIDGAFRKSSEADGRGLVAVGSGTVKSSAEIAIFSAATEVLFTNEGAGAIDLVAAVGCRALQLDAEVLGTPTWDSSSQRFLAEHEVVFSNELAHPRTRALHALNPAAADTTVHDLTVDVAVTAEGFERAEIIDIEMSELLRERWSEDFDGVRDTGLLSVPLRLSQGDPVRLRFTVAYEPDFDDPTWSEGVDAPAPVVQLRGQVDDVAVGLSASLRSGGPEFDAAVEPNRLITPAPGLLVDHVFTQDPASMPDGHVTTAERIVVTNVGETAVTDLRVEYPHVAMYGTRSRLVDLVNPGPDRCAEGARSSFDGAGQPLLISLPAGLAVGESCTVELQSKILPGEIPDATGSQYETAVVATAQSGRLSVRDATAVHVELAQKQELVIDSVAPAITNLRDGTYRIVGSITMANSGDQDLADVSSQLSFSTVDEDTPQAAFVTVESLTSASECAARQVPSRTVDGVGLVRDVTLPVGQTCVISFSLIARPGAVLDGWRIDATASGESPRAVVVDAEPLMDGFSFPESPAVAADLEVVDVVNNTDGTYTVELQTTVSNNGDTPLVEVLVPNPSEAVFGGRLLQTDAAADACSPVSVRRPLASTSPASTCEVRWITVVEPGEDLDGWMMTATVDAASPSGARVGTESSRSSIAFTENPSLATAVTLADVDRLSDGRFRFVLDGSLTNTGDIELRDVALTLDLANTFAPSEYAIVDVSSRTLSLERTFDGDEQIAVLDETNRLSSGEEARWNLTVIADTGADPGPFDFAVEARATSPAGHDLAPKTSSTQRSLPLVQVIDRSLVASNNNDGTYDVVHGVTVRNVGGVPLSGVTVNTDFDAVFAKVRVGDNVLDSTCESILAVGAACSIVEEAVVRPGAAVGPYRVDVFVSSQDAADLRAAVVDPPSTTLFESRALSPLFLEEAPSVTIDGEAGPTSNNGDGTYSTTYAFTVTNSGDVPLYELDIVDPVVATFEDVLVENFIPLDTCGGVSFEQPLRPAQTCEREQEVLVRPGAQLGPWSVSAVVQAETPTRATVSDSIELSPLTFTELVALSAESSLLARENYGDGTYGLTHEVIVKNTGDVPLIDVSTSDAGSTLGERRLAERSIIDECSRISDELTLAPGSSCRVELDIGILPGSELGPYELQTELVGTSPSGALATAETSTVPLTLTESPAFSLSSQVQSVESTDEETLRVIVDLVMVNSGDVSLDDVQLELDLREVFPDVSFRVDGLLSSDLDVSEAFVAGESIEMLVPDQSQSVDERSVVTLIVSITPNGNVGPFVGELRATGTSPAQQQITAVVGAQIDLPSIAIAPVARKIDNNRDGSYTVETSYEITNDGSTPLEFVGLLEDLDEVYEGVEAVLLTTHSNDVPLAELELAQRGLDILERGVGLDVGQAVVVTTRALVTPGNVLGPFLPAAQTRAVSPTGTEVVADLQAAEPIEFIEDPALRIEQELLGRPVWNSDGTFDVSFSIDLINDGDVELRNMQVNQDLLRALGEESRILVREIRSEKLTVNSDFDGLGQIPVEQSDEGAEPRELGDTRLLVGTDTLAAGDRATVELDMTITPESRGVYSTRTIVSGRTPGGAGLGSIGDEIEANTLTRLSVEGELGVAKQVIGEPQVRSDGGVAVTYEILVENAGPFPLSDVQVHDQLRQAFGTGSSFVTSRVRIEEQSPCDGHASSSYDGGAVDPVLVSGVELQPGERCRLQYDAVVLPSKALPGPFRSSAFAIGADPFSGIVIDDSTDGTDTDPDGNQEPGDNDIATAVRVEVPQPAAEMTVVVAEVNESTNDDWLDITIDVTITNTGPIDVDSTELIVDLDAVLEGPFDVMSVTSDDLLIDDGFDGEDRLNLVRRRNLIRSGESVSVQLQIQTARTRSESIETAFGFSAVSVAGDPIDSAPAESALIDVPPSSRGDNGNVFSQLSVEEQRLVALGGSAFALFFAIFVHRTVRRVRDRRARRALRRTPRHINERETIDLRDRPHATSRSNGDRVGPARHHARGRRRGRGPRIDH